jgi:gamma-glutamylcyclotransferase (GGCT)/AIG2-like uncharacterized protein YtfP
MEKQLVFIYGTLKQGQCRGHSMGNARYLGIALTTPNFAMYNVGDYPALITDNLASDHRVCGELYECDEDLLETLDRIEGVPHLYKRDTVELDTIHLVQLPTTLHTHKQFEQKRAISYFFVNHERLIEEAELIVTGFWTDELKKGF